MIQPRASQATVEPGRRRQRRGGPLFWIAVGVPLLLVGLVVLGIGARWWLDRFLHGDNFRRFLERKTSAALQAQAHLQPLRWDGSEVYTAGLNVRGTQQGPLTAFDADQVRAVFDLGALWRRVWRVESVDVERINANLGKDPSTKDAPDQPSPEQVAPPGADSHPLAFLLPRRMEVGEVRVADFTLGWNGDQPSQAGRLVGTRLKARMRGDVYTWDMEGTGGKLEQAGLPTKVALDNFSLRTTREAVFLSRAQGRLDGGGKLDLSGRQALTDDHALDLAAELADVPVDSFLPPDWRGRLRGKAAVRAQVTGSPEDAGSWRATGRIDLREGTLEALPVLDQLAVFSSSARYRRAVLQRGEADFIWSPGRLEVRNVVVESAGLLRIEGGFTVRAQQVDGLFHVGVALSSVRWIKEVGAIVFDLPQRDGYAWTTMHVSGPMDHPREDLTSRLAASAGQSLIRKAQQGGDTVLDAAGTLLDLLKGR